MSLIYGYTALGVIYWRLFNDPIYIHDNVATYVVAPLGAFVGFVVAAVIHELGHYAATRLAGGDARKILIGSGNHESFRSGAVLFFLDEIGHARLRLAFIIVSGPVASILLAAGSIAAAAALHTEASQSGTITYYAFAALAGFTLSNLGLLINVLVPRRYVYAGRLMETDMLRLFTILRMSNENLDAVIAAGKAARAEKSLLIG
jgi:Zn-dependent protease